MTDEVFSRVIFEDPEKFLQLRLTVNEFRGTQYLHIRKYFLDFVGDWIPTKEGISMPLGLTNTLALFLAVSELLTEAEKDLVEDSLREILNSYSEFIAENEIPF